MTKGDPGKGRRDPIKSMQKGRMRKFCKSYFCTKKFYSEEIFIFSTKNHCSISVK